jgi:hypothetical protein
MSVCGTKRTFKVLRRRSDVEGRADMARTLPEGDPRYATDFSVNRWCRLLTGGRLRFMVALAAPLRGTRYAGSRRSTLICVEKVRPQFLSLRQLGRSRAFSARTCWQLSLLVAAISHLGFGLQIGRACSFFSEWPNYLRSSGLCGFGTVVKTRMFRATYEL